MRFYPDFTGAVCIFTGDVYDKENRRMLETEMTTFEEIKKNEEIMTKAPAFR